MQTGFSIRTATRIRKNSPIATKVTFELLKRATELPFAKVLEADWAAAYRLAVRITLLVLMTVGHSPLISQGKTPSRCVDIHFRY